MKGSLLLLGAFFALTNFFASQTLYAQNTALADVAPSMNWSNDTRVTAASNVENDRKNHLFDINAGQQSPSFKGFDAYVSTHLIYPELARKNSIEGRVEILVTISDEGKILEAKIVKSLGFGCDEAALAVVRDMPDWTSAMNYGIPVKGKNIVGFDFRLR